MPPDRIYTPIDVTSNEYRLKTATRKDTTMNKTEMKGGWNQVKGKIKEKWGDFTEDEIASLEGNLDQIVGLIQKVYGFAKEQAECEYDAFRKSLGVVAFEARKNKTFGAVIILALSGLLISSATVVALLAQRRYKES